MRGHADLGRGKIECYLDHYDQADVCEPLFREWRTMMSQSKSSPRTDHAHEAAGRAYQLVDLNKPDFVQSNHACPGGEA